MANFFYIPRFFIFILLAVGSYLLPTFSACYGGEYEEFSVSTSEYVYSLQDCLRIASKQNPDVLIAAKQLDVGKGNILVAKSGFIPQVSASGGYAKRESQYVQDLAQDKNRRDKDYNVSSRVTQTVYSSGRVRAQVNISKQNLKELALNFNTTLDTVTLAVKQNFYQILQSEAAVAIRYQAVEILKQEFASQQRFFKAGEVPQVNVLRAQVNLANEKPLLYEAIYQLHANYLNLAQLMGVELNPQSLKFPFRVSGTLENKISLPSLEECIIQARAQRSDLLAKIVDIGIARKQITVDKAGTRPRVDLFAGYELFSEPNKLSKHDWYSGPICGIAVNWQIFDGLSTLGKVRADRAKVLIAADNLTQTRYTVQTEVRIAYEGVQQALKSLITQGDNIKTAKLSLELITNNVDNGLSNQLDLLQARFDYTRSQLTRLDSLFAYNVAVARLTRAMGQVTPILP